LHGARHTVRRKILVEHRPVLAGLTQEPADPRVVLPGGTAADPVARDGIRSIDRGVDGEAGRRDRSARLELRRRRIQVLLGLPPCSRGRARR
jgi:hypothetical protein